MTIVMTLTIEAVGDLPDASDPVRFFDVCAAGAECLKLLGQQALHDGDSDQFAGTSHAVIEGRTGEDLGTIVLSEAHVYRRT